MIDKAYLEKINEQMARLENDLSDPGVAGNPTKFKRLMMEHTHLKQLSKKAGRFFHLLDDRQESRALLNDPECDDDLRKMAEQELRELEEHIPRAERELMLALIPPDPSDSRNIIMEIRAGTGGEEAALFAGDLFRMYCRYAEETGWKISMIDSSESNVGGFKEVVFSIEGQEVYRKLRYESGVHRVQRVPQTEAQGRIHTSAATVAVLPEVEEVDEIVIKQEELRIDYFCASGPGGQKVNKTSSAVRLTHLETGIVVQSQDERSQLRNKEKAMMVLKARLLDKQRKAEEAREAGTRRSQIGSGDRSERIRTYNFPQNRVSDHRINLTLYSLDRFINGDLDDMIAALREYDMQTRIKEKTEAIA